ncbi:MAG: D-alanyl-D-alanine carboxypeptidase family protein [Methyloceanibacter sp.]|uniref:D-alanyl-D-alanine carboxypeptidase family protein n=1 Tax=Methyloceanibacter sp. TaxID=1965321 RepID=UPI003D6D959B
MTSPKRKLLPWAAILGGVMAAILPAGAPALGKPLAPPNVTAASVYVVNADTAQSLYEKNADKAYHILSLTKLITAYVLVERTSGQLTDTVTVTQAHIRPGSSAGLRRGDVWTLADLLYGTLLMSGNDASVAIADHVGRALLAQENKKGDPIARFVQDMRAAAASLGAKRTQFADPYGLSASNVSTARDFGLIGQTVFRDRRILPYWACPRRSLTIGGPQARTVTLDSTIEILGEDGILGAKTGSHVGKNMYHLIAGWRAPNGETIVTVVLGSKRNAARYDDMRAIIAALPRDFPQLADPATAAIAAPGGTSACR